MNNHKEISPAKDALPERISSGLYVTPFDNPKAGNFVMKKKRCPQCEKIKPTTSFPNKVSTRDGKYCWCKECTSKKSLAYRRTKLGVITQAYRNQKLGAQLRGQQPPSYSLEWLREWCMSQPVFHDIYNQWVSDDYDKWGRPSIDRINDFESYTPTNIQIITWKENNYKAHEARRNGDYIGQVKPVLKLSDDGCVIDEYVSVAEAGRLHGVTGPAISSSCKKGWRAAGYYWKFKNEE